MITHYGEAEKIIALLEDLLFTVKFGGIVLFIWITITAAMTAGNK